MSNWSDELELVQFFLRITSVFFSYMCCEEDKGEQCEQQRMDIKSSPADVSSSKIHIMHLPMFRLQYVRCMLVERVKNDL